MAAGIMTKDIGKALRVSKALQAGVVWVNTYAGSAPSAPFGGHKQSGYGRELGREALDAYTQVKTVWFGSEGQDATVDRFRS